MKFGSETESLKRQLAEAQKNLRLVRERKSEFVQQTDIPLQLIKDEQRLEQEIETLQARLAQYAVGVSIDDLPKKPLVLPIPPMDRFQELVISEVIAIASVTLAIWLSSQGIAPLTATCSTIILRAVPLVVAFSASGSLLTSIIACRIGDVAGSSLASRATRSRRDHVEAAAAGLLLLLITWIFIVLTST